MKTCTGANSASHIEPLLSNAQESIWIISPWIGSTYAKQLAGLSQKGIEVRIVTTNVEYNGESLEILKASENPNLIPLVIDQEKAAFIHSKIYIVDKNKAISGSANLTYSGLNKNIESLSIAETKDEVEQIETDFMRVWMNFERKRMSNEALSNGTAHSIKYALPLSTNYGENNNPNIKNKTLTYHPYYFFEYIFRGSVRSPPLLFEDKGFYLLDAARNRQIFRDKMLAEEIVAQPKTDYFIKTESKFNLQIKKSDVNFYEAKQLVIDFIRKTNTHRYTQQYGDRSYERLFVPRKSDISFVKSEFVRVPIWRIERHEQNGKKHQDYLFGSSGKKFNEQLYCPNCNNKVWIKQAVNCQMCGKQFCPNCINKVGLIFRKNLCKACEYKARNK